MGIVHKAAGGTAESGGKIIPGKESAEAEYGIRNIIRGDFRQASKDNRKDQHGGYRLNDGPGGSEDRLFISYLNVAPCQEVEKFPIFP